MVGRDNPVSEEIVDEFLGEPSDFHIGVHVQILDNEAVCLEHFPDGDHVRMNLSPGKRLHGNVEVICSGARHFQHRCRRESRAGVSVILDNDVRIFLLDFTRELRKECRTADACHILQTDFVAAVFHNLVNYAHIVFHRVHGRMGDGQCDLGYHSGLLRIFH